MPPSNNFSKTTAYNPKLDGLRGLAILLVICFHYFGGVPVFKLGWAGVDLFFVLSGFLITRSLLDNRNREDRYYRFYRNRALKIIPLYYLVLLAFFGAIFFVVQQQHFILFDFYVHHVASFVFFLQNWAYITDGLPAQNHLQHFWSLAVEEQFYLIWPWILYSYYQSTYFLRALWLTIVLVVLVRVVMAFQFPHVAIFYNTFCRIDSFIMGTIVYFLLQKESKPSRLMDFLLYGSLTIVVVNLLLTRNAEHLSVFNSTVGYTLFAFIFGGLLYKVAPAGNQRWLSRFFNNRFMVFNGKISYGLYIFHWPVFLATMIKLNSYLLAHVSSNYTVCLYISVICCILLTYAISILSYYYFERFFLLRKK